MWRWWGWWRENDRNLLVVVVVHSFSIQEAVLKYKLTVGSMWLRENKNKIKREN